ncbi:udp-glucuronic acid decarboxylase-related [Anaeramoeba ignava]|uniref:Udp-glucuronic acid decarboxylase-related n=1 Tax=Anaeramoeba ignava TaxID=1746090 RepID=A0A9Q0LPL1_ANAIG|nr:udp-glucuronic acid decarboxylase-related [Anaeramoeba ignava]
MEKYEEIEQDSEVVLVTGGAGFVGSHLVDRLMESGKTVIVIDNLYTGRKRNIFKWLNHPRFEFIRHDVVEPIKLQVDKIYHLACPASPVHYQSDPIKTTMTSVWGTRNMLELAKETGARLLFSSTSEVYGDPHVHPQTESYWGHVNPIGIRSCYDEGKRCAETLMFDYHRTHNVDIRVARIFNTYGPRMMENDGRVVSNFIIQALDGKDLTVYGDGKQTRSFCYVDDLVSGLIALMEGNITGPVNLGNPTEFTIMELANLVKEKIKNNVNVCYEKIPQDDPKQRKPDISLAKKEFNWEPKIPLTKGLDLTIEYFAKRYESQKKKESEKEKK